jgi:hypothetical protein
LEGKDYILELAGSADQKRGYHNGGQNRQRIMMSVHVRFKGTMYWQTHESRDRAEYYLTMEVLMTYLKEREADSVPEADGACSQRA